MNTWLTRSKKFLASGLALSAASATCFTALSYAHDFDMPQATQAYVTHRGQDMFRNHLTELLAANGVDFKSGSLPEFKYESPTALSLNHLPARFQKYAGTLRSLRDSLSDWLIGFTLHDPRFTLKVTGARYSAPTATVSIRVDSELSATWNEGHDGVAVYADVIIPEFRIDADQIRGADLNNGFLGQFGLNHAFLSYRNANKPLKVTLLNKIKARPDGGISFECLGVTTNIDTLNIDSGYDRDLVMPRVQIRVNDRFMTLNTAEIASALRQKKDQLVKMGQMHLKDFIETEVPARINQIAYDHLNRGFDLVKTVNAPGVDPYGNGTSFNWGLSLGDLSAEFGWLQMNLKGYIDDPDTTWDDSGAHRTSHRGPMLINKDWDTYDLMLAVNMDVVNRVILLGYLRGNLADIDSGDGSKLRLVRPPYMVNDRRARGHSRMHVTLQMITDGFEQTLALKSPFQVELDLDVRVEKSASGLGFNFVLDHILIGDSYIPSQYARFDSLRSNIATTLRERLEKLNEGYVATPKIIAEDIRVPDNLFNLPLRLNSLDFDENGWLTIYTDFGDISARPTVTGGPRP